MPLHTDEFELKTPLVDKSILALRSRILCEVALQAPQMRVDNLVAVAGVQVVLDAEHVFAAVL